MKPVAGIPIRPIDAAARDGALCLVSDGQHFATATWHPGSGPGQAGEFRFPSGAKVPFVPVGYHRPERADV
jgi:hypothetical protein